MNVLWKQINEFLVDFHCMGSFFDWILIPWPLYLLAITLLLHPLYLIKSKLFCKPRRSEPTKPLVIHDDQSKQSRNLCDFLGCENIVIIVEGFVDSSSLRAALFKRGFRVIVIKPRVQSCDSYNDSLAWMKAEKQEIAKYANQLRNNSRNVAIRWIVLDIAQVFFQSQIREKKVLFVNPISKVDVKVISAVNMFQYLVYLSGISKYIKQVIDVEQLECLSPLIFSPYIVLKPILSNLFIQYIIEQTHLKIPWISNDASQLTPRVSYDFFGKSEGKEEKVLELINKL